MKFIVAQIGARRRYAVPTLLEDAGMLERFYTDCSGDIGLSRALAQLKGLPVIGKPARRLASRALPPNIRRKTTTFPFRTILHSLHQALLQPHAAAAFRSALRFSNALGHAMVRCGFGEATHVYSMLGECAPLLIAAKERVTADLSGRRPNLRTSGPGCAVFPETRQFYGDFGGAAMGRCAPPVGSHG